MILQSGVTFRSFAEQRCFSFNTNISASIYSGNSAIGFSGNGNYYDFFKFRSGKVYDALDRFVYTYSKDVPINLSGDFCSGRLGYHINNNLYSMSTQVCDSSKSFDYFIISTSGAALDFDIDIYGGLTPNYNITFNGSNILTGTNITGNVVNNSSNNWQSFKIFSGDASFNYSNYKFQSNFNNLEISGGRSGNFLFNYSGNGSDYFLSEQTGIYPLEYNFNLYTNFGLKNNTGVVNLNYIPPSSIAYSLEDSGIAADSFYFNYLLDGKLCNDSNYIFTLEKVSGFNYVNRTGSRFLVTGLASGTVSGFISGFGNLSGVVSGNLDSDKTDFYGNKLICSGCRYDYLEPFYATGMVDYFYRVRLTGLASGYNPDTASSGIVTGIISGSGILSKLATSGYAQWTGVLITGTGSLGKVYVKPSGTIPGQQSDYTEISNAWYSNFSGVFDFQVDKTGFYSSGLMNREVTTAADFLNYVNYDADFKYNFNIKSGGYSSNDGSVYSGLNINYNSTLGLYSGSGFLPSSTCFPIVQNPSRYVKFEINHYNPYNSGNNIMRYRVSGIGGEYLFTGLIRE
jgi:hypothetical protein